MARAPVQTSTDPRLVVAPLLLLALAAVSTAGYCWLEQLSLREGLYMTVITLSTVGFREVKDLSPAGQWWTIVVIVLGVGTAAASFSFLVAAITGGQLRRVLGRRQVQRAIDGLTGHTVVCGYGRMGRLVVQDLLQAGRDVVVVDSDHEAAGLAESSGRLVVRGDAMEEATLHSAGTGRAAGLVACLPNDADNLFLTLTARQLGRNLVIVSRAESMSTQTKLIRAGASRVVCPPLIGAVRMSDMILRPAVVDFFDMAHKGVDLEMDQLVVGLRSGLAGKTLRELALPARTGAMVVAVRSAEGETTYNPGPDVQVQPGDTLVLVGRRGVAEAVQSLQAQLLEPGQ